MTTTVVFYATDTMADWEYGYLLAGFAMAEGQDPGRFRVVVASADGEPVTSMGGLRVTPETSLSRLSAEDVDALVLPGAATWEGDEGHQIALGLADRRAGRRRCGRRHLRSDVRAGEGRPAERPGPHQQRRRLTWPPHPVTTAPRATGRRRS